MFHASFKLSVFLPLLIASTASAASWCVSSTGANGCLKTIGAAVTAAGAGDTISVAAGTYKEMVTIGEPLTLIGADAATTIIEAKGLANGIYVDGIDNKNLGNVFISGFTVQNANFEGILVTNATAITIASNILQGNDTSIDFSGAQPACPGIPAFETGENFDCGEAVHLSGADHSSIIGNTIQNNAGGILITDDTGAAHHNLISGNTVTNNPFDCGITIASHPPADVAKSATPLGVYSNIVVGNTSTKNGLQGDGAGVGIFASSPGTGSYNNMVTNNILTGNGIPGVSIHGHAPNQNLNGNQIIGNTISANGADTDPTATPGPAGINIWGVSPITGIVISQNTFTSEALDIVVSAPGDFRIVRNTFSKGGVGVMNASGGRVNADGNYWGCGTDPRFPFPGFTSCAGIAGNVSLTTWQSVPFSK